MAGSAPAAAYRAARLAACAALTCTEPATPLGYAAKERGIGFHLSKAFSASTAMAALAAPTGVSGKPQRPADNVVESVPTAWTRPKVSALDAKASEWTPAPAPPTRRKSTRRRRHRKPEPSPSSSDSTPEKLSALGELRVHAPGCSCTRVARARAKHAADSRASGYARGGVLFYLRETRKKKAKNWKT